MLRKLLLASLAVGGLFVSSVAYAQTDASTTPPTPPAPPAITFPIKELGSCASKTECKAYCDDSSHTQACIAFGEAHGLMKKDEAKKARDFSTMKGPGGCVGIACKAYCEDTSHQAECVTFGQEHGLIKPEEAKIIQDIQQNGGPGACRSKEECMAYCSDSTHMSECQAFAAAHGFAPRPQDGQGAQDTVSASSTQPDNGPTNPTIKALLEKNGGPGGCTTKDSCRQYCDASEHTSECLSFAKDHALISKEQFDKAKQVTDLAGPGGCKGATCRTYCSDTSHQAECLKFGQEHGLISQEQVKRTEQFQAAIKDGGPGGCTDATSCKSFCSDSANMDTCQSFAQQHGFGPSPSGDQQGDNTMPPQEGMQQGGQPSDATGATTGYGARGQTGTQGYVKPMMNGQYPSGQPTTGTDQTYPDQKYPSTYPNTVNTEQYKQQYVQPPTGTSDMKYPTTQAGTQQPPTGTTQYQQYPSGTGTTDQYKQQYTQPSGTTQYQQYPSGTSGSYQSQPSSPPPPTQGAGVFWGVLHFFGLN